MWSCAGRLSRRKVKVWSSASEWQKKSVVLGNFFRHKVISPGITFSIANFDNKKTAKRK